MKHSIVNVCNPHERIVRGTETDGDVTRRFYVIRDKKLGYWRGTDALDEPYAWTRDIGRRAEFRHRRDAVRELKFIWSWRRAQTTEVQPIMAPFWARNGRVA